MIPSWVDSEAWAGFVEMRKSIKKPLSPRAIKLAITRLEKLLKEGHDPTAVLDQSTFHCWQGLFPIRREDGQVTGQNATGQRGNRGRDFAAERDERKRERYATACNGSDNTVRDVLRERVVNLRDRVVEDPHNDVPSMEAKQNLRLHGGIK